MKRTIMLVIITIIIGVGFILFIDHLIDMGIYKLTGSIEKAILDSNGNIVIIEEEIIDKATYINYEYEGVTIGLIAVRDSNEKVKVVVNASKSCREAPKAFFVQDGKKLKCQNCSTSFFIDDLDYNINGECNPIGIKDRTDVDGKIIIGTNQLKELKGKFIDWRGPKL